MMAIMPLAAIAALESVGEIVETIHDGLCGGKFYLRSVLLKKAGTVGEQHVHQYDHPTYCGSGSAEFWENGKMVGVVMAGGAAEVKAGQKHYFVALEDNTRLVCIHDATSAEEQRRL